MNNYCPNAVTNLTCGENNGDGVAAAPGEALLVMWPVMRPAGVVDHTL